MNEGLVVFVRGVIAFFTLLIFARVLGKQQISQLTFFDYILGITIGSSAASLTTDLTSAAWPHWIGILTWVLLVLLIQWVTVKWRSAGQELNSEPTIVIVNGKIMDEAMKKMRYSLSDLLEQLRLKDVFDLSQVEFAVLETNGQLSVLKKTQYQPLTPKDMNISTKYAGLSTELIFNGLVIESNLSQANLNRQWLMKELRKQNISDVSAVFYASLDSSGNLYVDLYKDHVDMTTNLSN